MQSISPLRRAVLHGFAAALLGFGLVASAFAAGVRIEDAWIRWLPAGLPAGGYGKVVNDTGKEVRIVGASSPDYGEVMLHRSVNQNGVMKMIHVDAIPVAAHGSMAFAPGGYHIMLMQPKAGIEPGAKVPVTLKLADGKSLTAEFEVRKPTASGPATDKGGDMGGMKGMQH